MIVDESVESLRTRFAIGFQNRLNGLTRDWAQVRQSIEGG